MWPGSQHRNYFIGDHRELQEAEAVPDVLVPGQVTSSTLQQCVKTTLCFSAKIKKKMLYSSSFDALKKSLVGVHKYIQVSRHETTQLLLNTVDG